MSDKKVWVELAPLELRIIRIFKSHNAAMASGTSIALYYSRVEAVGAVRHQIWLRCKGECELCASPINESSGHMHEMQHRGKGGEISLANSVFICPKCHANAHKDRNPRWSKRGGVSAS